MSGRLVEIRLDLYLKILEKFVGLIVILRGLCIYHLIVWSNYYYLIPQEVLTPMFTGDHSLGVTDGMSP